MNDLVHSAKVSNQGAVLFVCLLVCLFVFVFVSSLYRSALESKVYGLQSLHTPLEQIQFIA